MSHRHHSHVTRNRENKRAQFAEQSQQKISSTAILVIIFTVLFAVALYLVMGVNDRPASTSVATTNASPITASANRAQSPSASETGDDARGLPVRSIALFALGRAD